MPLDDATSRVDDKGRLRLPQRFHQALISIQEEWFVVPTNDKTTFHISISGEADSAMRIDAAGRILVPPDWSARFKMKTVHLYWSEDRMVVTTEDRRQLVFEKVESRM